MEGCGGRGTTVTCGATFLVYLLILRAVLLGGEARCTTLRRGGEALVERGVDAFGYAAGMGAAGMGERADSEGLLAGLLAGRSAIVITASDRCFAGTQVDVSGPAVAAVLRAAGAEVLETLVVPDVQGRLEEALRAAASRCRLVVTTGGTGLGPRDVTPEATAAVCERMVPGIAELIRKDGLQQTRFAALGRGICGTVGSTLLVNVPGNPAGAESSLRAVLGLLPHALDLLGGRTEHAG